MKRAAAALVLVAIGCRPHRYDIGGGIDPGFHVQDPPRVDVPTEAELLADVQWLASPERDGRLAGSDGERASFAWLEKRFRALGLDVTMRRVPLAGPGETQDLVAVLPGNDPRAGWILVGAHVDHLGPGYPGADDNASGVAAMLGVATAMAHSPRIGATVVFVGFGGEEQGLIGSRFLASDPPLPLARCTAMINLDMVGRSPFLGAGDYSIPKALAGIKNGPAVGILDDVPDSPLLATARKACAITTYAAEDFPTLSPRIRDEAKNRSDDSPFAEQGVHTLFFSTSLQDDYHQPTDTADKIDPVILRGVARCVRGTVESLAHPAR